MSIDIEEIWKQAKCDPSLQNTLDIGALLGGTSKKSNHSPLLEDECFQVLNSIRPSLPKPTLYEIHKKLDGFLPIEELHELRMGKYTRWIRHDDLVTLKSGGILVDIRFTGTGTILSILPLKAKHPFSLKFDESFIFQKMTKEELFIAAAVAAASKPL